eukprot:1179910-Prorocentrum_minimum.AAC.2
MRAHLKAQSQLLPRKHFVRDMAKAVMRVLNVGSDLTSGGVVKLGNLDTERRPVKPRRRVKSWRAFYRCSCCVSKPNELKLQNQLRVGRQDRTPRCNIGAIKRSAKTLKTPKRPKQDPRWSNAEMGMLHLLMIVLELPTVIKNPTVVTGELHSFVA